MYKPHDIIILDTNQASIIVKLTSLSKSAKIEILESVESFDTWIDQNL